jgi:hypothetical protein
MSRGKNYLSNWRVIRSFNIWSEALDLAFCILGVGSDLKVMLKAILDDRLAASSSNGESEDLGVAVTLLEVDFITLDDVVGHLGLGNDISSVDLVHLFAILVRADERELVVSFKSLLKVSKLADLDESSTGTLYSQLELRQFAKVGGLDNVALLGGLEPAFLLGEDTAGIEVLEVLQQVRRTHPENTIGNILGVISVSWRLVTQTRFSFGGPHLGVIGPVAHPLKSIVSRSVGVSQLN